MYKSLYHFWYVKNLGGTCDTDGREVTKGRNINRKQRLIFISTVFKKLFWFFKSLFCGRSKIKSISN